MMIYIYAYKNEKGYIGSIIATLCSVLTIVSGHVKVPIILNDTSFGNLLKKGKLKLDLKHVAGALSFSTRVGKEYKK